MKNGKKIIAVVPARSGSKGIPDKNMQVLGGRSLIGWTGAVLKSPKLDWIDRILLSTDSERYAEEGRKSGLECPFLRPEELSKDQTGAVETLQYVWKQAESHYAETYDILLIVEPTCPLRLPEDIQSTVDTLFEKQADSVVSVCPVDTKFHPHKILKMEDDHLTLASPMGAQVKTRQSLSPYYYRNGACYALTRKSLLERGEIFGENTFPVVINRPIVNIDEPEDLELARYYIEKRGVLATV
jgi:CMP-N-acetylneuraminic acid synthetase